MRVAVIGGDGVGPEVTAAAVGVLEAVAASHGLSLELETWDLGADRYLRDGVTITDAEFERLSGGSEAILLGALGDPRVPGNEHARDILLGLRFRLDLYVNYRPCILLRPEHCPLRGFEDRPVALHIFRENTEGLYAGIGGALKVGTPDEIAVQEGIHTWKGVERIVRAAFEHARRHELPRVTMVDKANAMPVAGRLWRRAFEAVGAEFPEIPRDVAYIDAMAMDLVRRPDTYSVLVTSNLFGDILSDQAAAITGGLGLAPSVNLHPGRHALFEPVHGSAPDIAGTGQANPMAAIRCVELLLDHFGHQDAAASVRRGLHLAIERGETTPDLGGHQSTAGVGAAISAWIRDE